MTISTRYLIFDILDFWTGDSCHIRNIEIRDDTNSVLPFTTEFSGAYDLTRSNIPKYWNNPNIWGKDKFSNGISDVGSIYYSTIFMKGSEPLNVDNKARFFIDVGSTSNIQTIKVWGGSAEGGMPKQIVIYESAFSYSIGNTIFTNFNNTFEGIVGSLEWDFGDLISDEKEIEIVDNYTLPSPPTEPADNRWEDVRLLVNIERNF